MQEDNVIGLDSSYIWEVGVVSRDFARINHLQNGAPPRDTPSFFTLQSMDQWSWIVSLRDLLERSVLHELIRVIKKVF